MSYHIGLQVLRAKIRGLQAAGITLQGRIRKVSGSKRGELRNEKRRLGNYSRVHLIAYGLLRGIQYTRIERCAENNRPNIATVLELMKEHAEWPDVRKFTLETVTAMLMIQPQTSPSHTSALHESQSPERVQQPTSQEVVPTVQRPLEKSA